MATVKSPAGNVVESVLFEHIYENMPSFTPDRPGEYTLVIEATGEFTDGNSVAMASVQHEVRISVSGMPLSVGSTGCSATSSPTSDAPFVLVLLFLCGTIIQRRKSDSIASYDNKVI